MIHELLKTISHYFALTEQIEFSNLKAEPIMDDLTQKAGDVSKIPNILKDLPELERRLVENKTGNLYFIKYLEFDC